MARYLYKDTWKTVKIWNCDVVCQETLTESQAAATPGTVIVSEKIS